MKLRRLCVALVLLAGSASLGLAQSDKYTPRLSNIMVTAQTQHLKPVSYTHLTLPTN